MEQSAAQCPTTAWCKCRLHCMSIHSVHLGQTCGWLCIDVAANSIPPDDLSDVREPAHGNDLASTSTHAPHHHAHSPFSRIIAWLSLSRYRGQSQTINKHPWCTIQNGTMKCDEKSWRQKSQILDCQDGQKSQKSEKRIRIFANVNHGPDQNHPSSTDEHGWCVGVNRASNERRSCP